MGTVTTSTLRGITLILAGLMPVLALSGLVPALPQLFQQFAAEPNRELLVPMIITVPSLCVALFSGFAGAIADRWGRRPLLLVSLFAFGALGTHDRARHLATLYLNDIADVLREAVDARFEFVRYAEQLATSQPSCEPSKAKMTTPTMAMVMISFLMVVSFCCVLDA